MDTYYLYTYVLSIPNLMKYEAYPLKMDVHTILRSSLCKEEQANGFIAR